MQQEAVSDLWHHVSRMEMRLGAMQVLLGAALAAAEDNPRLPALLRRAHDEFMASFLNLPGISDDMIAEYRECLASLTPAKLSELVK